MRKLLRFVKPYRLAIIIGSGLIFIQVILELLLPTLMGNIVDIGVAEGDMAYIFKTGGFMTLAASAVILLAVISIYLSSKVSMSFARDVRSEIFRKAESFSLNEFDRIGTPSLITRTTNDVTQVQQVVMMSLRILARAPMITVGSVIMAVYKNPRLSLIIVFILPIIILGVLIVTKKGVPLFRSIQIKIDRLNQILRENLMGVRVIRAFNRTDYEKKRFETANRDITDITIRVSRIMAVMMPAITLVLNFTIVAVIWYGAINIDRGVMQIGDLIAFIQYVIQSMFYLAMLSMIFIMISRASASATRINQVLDIEPEITDPENPEISDIKNGVIEFKNVTFSYHGAEKPALKDISFIAKPGEVTAIIGGTGSGKSTLINLIPRFYDVDSGSILIDGVDIRKMTQKTLRENIGFVPQKSVLFTGTVSGNIKHGKEDATDEEVRHAAEIAQAAEFVSNMGEGFDSVIAQGGTNVSGGQKQRLSIARALVRKPKIYLFDDSFSALDFKTDARLRSALEDETVESTLIIVSQRVSTVMDADQIIVLDGGTISGIGNHRELLKTSSVYREIVSSQLSEEEIA
ncbi:MAG: ABC transporter ATP-binding protein [Candidatus Alkaliphilus sp. MAG34]|nr:ABC transporter ATP-binding protein [Clostridiales bacterium]